MGEGVFSEYNSCVLTTSTILPAENKIALTARPSVVKSHPEWVKRQLKLELLKSQLELLKSELGFLKLGPVNLRLDIEKLRPERKVRQIGVHFVAPL